jgi:hypothetical protein
MLQAARHVAEHLNVLTGMQKMRNVCKCVIVGE